MKYYTIGQFSKFVGKSIQTLRLWDNEGKLKPHHKTDGGHRYYSEQQINQVLQVPLIKKNKKGLNQLIDIITNSEVERIVILYKDRLLRFGFEIIENLCNKYGTTIEIIDNTEKTEEQELVEDLVQIVTIFSCRLQGKRANKAKKMIKELLENDTIEES